jgi:hypothetical protein
MSGKPVAASVVVRSGARTCRSFPEEVFTAEDAWCLYFVPLTSRNKMKSYAKTFLGTPVYKIDVPQDLLTSKGRCVNPPARGKLCDFIKEQVQPPACVIVHAGKKFHRIFKLCEEGMLIPSSKSIIPRQELQKMVDAGVLEKGSL